MYEYAIDLAEQDETLTAPDLIFRVKTYPDDFGMTNLSPSEFASLTNRIKNDEETAKYFYNRMCQNVTCNIENCDDICRTELSCILENSS